LGPSRYRRHVRSRRGWAAGRRGADRVCGAAAGPGAGMTKVSFYHLTTAPLEQALPVLLEKSLQAGLRVVLMAGSRERVAHLDAHLWTFDPASFIPHGSGRDGTESRQPIFLTDADENPNSAELLVLTDGVTSRHLPDFTRCLNLFD